MTNKSGLLIPGLTYHSCGILLPDIWDKERENQRGEWGMAAIYAQWDVGWIYVDQKLWTGGC